MKQTEEMKMEWISFKYRWPEKKLKEILIYENLMHIKTKKKISHISIESVNDLYIENDVIFSHTGGEHLSHWMPLPESPHSLP